jgi:hypothetical protein
VAMEEAQEAPDVVIGMFLVNDTYEVVLFVSGASHSFISAAYVGKHNLLLALLRCQMIVSSPGGDMPTRHLCPKVNLKIREVDFVANLIVWESMGIDVIHRMDWLCEGEPTRCSQGSEVPVVNEFPNVFPEEFVTVPPQK